MITRFVGQLGLGPRWRLRGSLSRPGSSCCAPLENEIAAMNVADGENLPLADSIDRKHSIVASAIEPPAPILRLGETPACSQFFGGWSEAKSAVSVCVNCGLSEQRTQAVFGVGDEAADWLFVGEGPGAEEDLRGEPFVGQAGKLLDSMLAGLGIVRGQGVYIANAVKCRPPNNRTPEPDEIEACFPYLQRQIELIRPRVIVALGRPAAQALLKQEIRIGAARGQVFRFGEIPVVVTYHPAYLLRNPADKGKAWADLCFARKTLASSPPKVKETA